MDPWFSVEGASAFRFLSLLSLLALVQLLIMRGKARAAVIGCWYAMIGLGVAMLAAGFVAKAGGQPEHVTRTLMTTGIVLAAVFAGTLFPVRKGYRQAEERQIAARDL